MQMGNSINRALDLFFDTCFHFDINILRHLEREIGLGLHRVRVIEVLILPHFGEKSQVVLNLFLSIHSCKASMTMRS